MLKRLAGVLHRREGNRNLRWMALLVVDTNGCRQKSGGLPMMRKGFGSVRYCCWNTGAPGALRLEVAGSAWVVGDGEGRGREKGLGRRLVARSKLRNDHRVLITGEFRHPP